jgi:F0F1-type ATP synthase assembly protein I
MANPANDLGSQGLAAAFTFAAAVAVFTFGGYWLDRRLGTGVLFVIVGFLVGVAGGFLHLLSRLAPEYLPFRRRARRGKAIQRPERGDDAPPSSKVP